MTEETLDIQVVSDGINLVRAPKKVLADAVEAANALMEIVNKKPNPVIFNKRRYLEFEDWQTVGKFYGLTAKVRSTTFIDYGGVKGFEAVADVVRHDGTVVSAGEGMCLNDEENWSTRPKYEWQDELDENNKKIWVEATAHRKGHYKSNKVKVGDVPVPLFQLRSMAQTRACAKALRNVVAWVVVLAGFDPTPAEEMTGTEHDEKETPNRPQPKPETTEHKEPASQEDASKAKAPNGIKMVSKKNGICGHCGLEIVIGNPIVWDGTAKRAYHEGCVA